MLEANLFTVLLSLIAAITTCVTTYLTLKLKGQVSEMEVKVDGRLTQLLAEKGKASRAEGKVEGIIEGAGIAQNSGSPPLP